MKGIRITALGGNFGKREAGGVDELDGAFGLMTPKEGGRGLQPGVAKKLAETRKRDAGAAGEIGGGREGEGRVEENLQGADDGGMTGRMGERRLAKSVGGEAEHAGAGKSTKGQEVGAAGGNGEGKPLINEAVNGLGDGMGLAG